jgi:hypothetical protein
MDLFPFTRDLQAFLLRVTASLERLDGAVAEAQLLIRDAREILAAIRTPPSR